MYMSTRVHKNTWNRTERFRRARAKEECLSDAVRCCALCMGHFRTRLQHAQRTRMREVPRKSRRSRFSRRSADVYGEAVSFSSKIEADEGDNGCARVQTDIPRRARFFASALEI